MTVSLTDQIACVRREIGFRKFVYKRRVADGKMSQAKAAAEIAAMEAVLVTLESMAENERLI